MGKATFVGIVSDMHVGSKYALCPPVVDTSSGGQYKASPLQLRIYEFWEQLARKWRNKLDYLVLNGEPIDGTGRNGSRGQDCWDIDVKSQMRAANQCLDMFGKPTRYMTQGSAYHTTVDGQSIDEFFGEKYGFIKNPAYNCYAPKEWNLRIDDIVFSFSHVAPYTRKFPHIAPSANELNDYLLHVLLEERERPDIVVRSHVHYSLDYRIENKIRLIQTPGWKPYDSYILNKSPVGYINPQIGMYVVKIENGECSVIPEIRSCPLGDGKVFEAK
jgi:hypothetical protein